MPLLAPYLIAGGPVLLATGWCIAPRCAAGGRTRRCAALAVGWLAVFAVAVAGRGVANEYRALGLAARAAMRPDDRLALYGSFVAEHRLLQRAGASIMIGYRGELDFGSQQGDQRRLVLARPRRPARASGPRRGGCSW